MRRVCERDALVIDENVGMVVGGFSLRRQPVDEGHGLRKAGKRELLPDGVAFERPARQFLEMLLSLGPGELHETTFLPEPRFKCCPIRRHF